MIAAIIIACLLVTFSLWPRDSGEAVPGKYHVVYEENGKEKFAAWYLNMTESEGQRCCVEWFLTHHPNLKNLRAVPTNYKLKT